MRSYTRATGSGTILDFSDQRLKQYADYSKNNFKVVCKEDGSPDANVLGGRFLIAIKNTETDKPIVKARFVEQGHTDVEKKMVVMHSTNTVPQYSVRMLIAIASIFWRHNMVSRHFSGIFTVRGSTDEGCIRESCRCVPAKQLTIVQIDETSIRFDGFWRLLRSIVYTILNVRLENVSLGWRSITFWHENERQDSRHHGNICV